MQIVIVGAGAMGCLFGSLIAAAGEEVLLYDVDSTKVDKINQNGITIIKKGEEPRKIMVKAVDSLDSVDPQNLFILLVKSYQTERAAREISLISNEKTSVLTLQNGFGNVEEICKYLPSKQVFAGVTYQSATELAPGKIYHTGSGLTIVAPLLKESMPIAMEQARLFNNCSITAGATSGLEAISWKKLIINSAINPLAALYGVENGKLPKNPEAVRDMAALVVEGVAVAQKVGIPLDYGEIWASLLETCRRTAENKASMLADVEAGRITEIQAINGSIINIGERHGVDTPTNLRMLRSVVAIHGGRGL
ncbi:MAG: ketopantoate reductase family protein [Bacillota bacterium]|jgi:2-dehydropantoate 2-reductase